MFEQGLWHQHPWIGTPPVLHRGTHALGLDATAASTQQVADRSELVISGHLDPDGVAFGRRRHVRLQMYIDSVSQPPDLLTGWMLIHQARQCDDALQPGDCIGCHMGTRRVKAPRLNGLNHLGRHTCRGAMPARSHRPDAPGADFRDNGSDRIAPRGNRQPWKSRLGGGHTPPYQAARRSLARGKRQDSDHRSDADKPLSALHPAIVLG